VNRSTEHGKPETVDEVVTVNDQATSERTRMEYLSIDRETHTQGDELEEPVWPVAGMKRRQSQVPTEAGKFATRDETEVREPHRFSKTFDTHFGTATLTKGYGQTEAQLNADLAVIEDGETPYVQVEEAPDGLWDYMVLRVPRNDNGAIRTYTDYAFTYPVNRNGTEYQRTVSVKYYALSQSSSAGSHAAESDAPGARVGRDGGMLRAVKVTDA